LSLSYVHGISDNAVTSIVNNLKHSLEELDLSVSSITLAKLMELKSMTKLKVLNCRHLQSNEIKTLSNNLPHLKKPINEDGLCIGLYDRADPEEGFWEIDAKQLEIFRDHTVNWVG